MGDLDTPTTPGWYPHRYGDEGMESYWNGREWTGERTVSRVGAWASEASRVVGASLVIALVVPVALIAIGFGAWALGGLVALLAGVVFVVLCGGAVAVMRSLRDSW